MLNMECDVSNKCRSCLTPKRNMYALFETYEDDLTLADIIQRFLKVQLNLHNNFPKKICEDCATLLIKFYNFAIVFEESNKILEKYLNTEFNNCSASEVKSDESLDVKPVSPALDNNIYDEQANNIKETYNGCLDSNHDKETVYENTDTIENTQNEVDCNADAEEIIIRITDNLNCSTNEANNKCNICHRTFESMLFLKKHLGLHIQNKKFVCEICGYVTLKKSSLVDHMEMHTTNKPYECQYCGKKFRRRSTFSRHKKTHTNPMGIICEMCGRTFTEIGTLKTHIHLKHVKTRNFKCIICNRSFSLKSVLEKHVKRHQQKETAKKNFTCSECGLQYFDKSSLKRHFEFKHKFNENVKT